MRIGITDTYGEDVYENYVEWLRTVGGSIECVKLSSMLDNLDAIQNLQGLLLSGGGDVHPKFYNHPDAVQQVHGADEQRDAFEMELIEHALDREMPIFGVCRGMQMMNVYLNGTLIPDVVAAGYASHTGGEEPIDHALSIVPDSLLSALTNTTEAEVNSFHHQAVNRLGYGLKAAAFSPDGIVEAAEWILKDGMPFLMLVQWHPERRKEYLLSHKLALMFLREATNYKHTMNHTSKITERIN